MGRVRLALAGVGLLVGMAGCVLARGAPPRGGEQRPQPVRVSLTLDGQPITVHALPTGFVTVKGCHYTGCLPESAPYLLRFAAIVAATGFAEPMPVWTYLIEHPGGRFVVDAGAEPAYNDDASWAADPVSGRLMRSFIGLDVRVDEALPARLRALRIEPESVDALVLTHQHVDHTGAVPAFPMADVWTAAAEDAAAGSIGAVPFRWRTGARIRWVDVEGAATEIGRAVSLAPDGSLDVFHTPGHTPGSLTVRLRTDQGTLWFTGDTAFTAEAMDPHAPTAGIHTDLPAVRALQTVLGSLGPGAVLLPSHDPGVPERLRALTDG